MKQIPKRYLIPAAALCMILLTAAAGLILWCLAPRWMDDPTIALAKQTPVRVYYDRNGNEAYLERTYDVQWRFHTPIADIPDVSFCNTEHEPWMWARSFVLFKYQPGTWNECRKMIEEMQQNELPDKKLFLFSQEEEFNKYLVAEDTLSGLLNFASCVCLLIAIFGIYSLITLTCEQRRKEIAIRKINGARVKDILQMFLHEYLLLLTLAALIAFPLTYAVMKQWIET